MTGPLAQPVVCPVLIGRVPLVEALQRAIDEVRSGGGVRTVLIAGEAGIGKSRLVAEARSYAVACGFLPLQGACYPQDSACPYAPLLDLLRAHFVDRPPAAFAAAERYYGELFPLLPDVLPPPDGPPVPARYPEQEQRRLFAALAACLAGPGPREPRLLIVEDLHWSDEGSLDFLLYLARRAASQPLLVLGTYRSDEVGPSLRHWLAQMDRAHLAEEIGLAPLTRDEVAAMLRAIFDQPRPVRVAFRDAIYALAEGNPFCVEELLKSLVTAGDIFYTDGGWNRKPLEELRIPRSLQDAVQERVLPLSAPARTLLALAAVVGLRFDFVLLQELAQLAEPELTPLLKELIAAQLLAEESSERFAFRHALTRQAILAELLARERAGLHRTVAETIERVHGALLEPHLADLAYHYHAAGSWRAALHYGQRAGERARALHAPRAALEHFTYALDAANQFTAPAPFGVYRARGQAYETVGEFELARNDYEHALAGTRAAQDGAAEWQSLIDLGGLWAERDYEQAGLFLRRALDLANTLGDPRLRAHSLNGMGNWLVNTGQAAEGVQVHREALALFQNQGDKQSIAETLDLLGMANGIYGDVVTSIECFDAAIVGFRALGDTKNLSSSLASRAAYSCPLQDELQISALRTVQDCARDAEEALRLARQIDWAAGQAYAEFATGLVFGGFGDLGAGLQHAQESLRVASEIGHRQWMAGAHHTLGNIYTLLLAPDLAIAHLQQALALGRSLGSAWWRGGATAGLARAYLLKNDLANAEATLQAEVPAQQQPRNLQERRARRVWGELTVRQGQPLVALQIADGLIESLPNDPVQPQSIPALLKLRGAALLALSRVDEAQQTLEEARRGALQRGDQPLLWQIDVARGQALQQAGHGDEARRAYTAARETIAGLAATIADADHRARFLLGAHADLPPEKPAPARESPSARLGGLTAREYEVAGLIARGQSNGEIAATLVVGKRTVEAHVGNILGKLGFTARGQIVAWAIQQGLLKLGE